MAVVISCELEVDKWDVKFNNITKNDMQPITESNHLNQCEPGNRKRSIILS